MRLSTAIILAGLLASGSAMAQQMSQPMPSDQYARYQARAADEQAQRERLAACMVYLPSIKDTAQRIWCYAQSKRMP
jgi:hypothetical protein